MDKYRIKNCPAISFADGCKNKEVKVWDCQDCTDCLLKQIVELCKGEQQSRVATNILSNKILKLLDIEEVE